MQKGQDVVRLRHYVCPHRGTEVGNREVAMKRLTDWLEQTKQTQLILRTPLRRKCRIIDRHLSNQSLDHSRLSRIRICH